MSSRGWWALLAPLFWAPLLASCSPPEVELPEPRPRPVHVLELREVDPAKALEVTGAVRSWKEQDVAFEVAGTLHSIVEPMTNLEGRWVEFGDSSGDSQVIVEGDVLARLSREEYLIQRENARAAVRVATENRDLAQVELDKVIPADIRAATADRERASAELSRIEKAVASGAVSEIDRIRALAELERAEAALERANASVESKRAQIDSLTASIAQAQAQLADAEYALARCTLQAPFPAQVATLLVEAGGFVQPGTPVAHLIMMDPILIDVNVSAQTAEHLRIGSLVSFRVQGSDDRKKGRVYEKAAVADPRTRTFRVSILTRNWQTAAGRELGDPIFGQYPVCPGAHVVSPRRVGDASSPLVVMEGRNLRRDDQGWYVWANTEMTLPLPDPPLVPVRKVRVTPGEGRLNFQGIAVARELADAGGLAVGNLCPIDVPEGHEEGAPVVVAAREWALLPGKLAGVLLEAESPQPGIYVPMDVVRPAGDGRGRVFVLDQGVARAVDVLITDRSLDRVRIAAADAAHADLVQAGRQIVADFVHFLRDGDAVKAAGVREMSQ